MCTNGQTYAGRFLKVKEPKRPRKSILKSNTDNLRNITTNKLGMYTGKHQKNREKNRINRNNTFLSSFWVLKYDSPFKNMCMCYSEYIIGR
jgi:hypothetical protein